jgi:hypothetical protein
VRLACERPALLGRRLSQGDCAALAHQLSAEGMVTSSSVTTVRRMLAAHQRKPWRHQVWRPPTQPRDAACYPTISELLALYPRPRGPAALVLSVDEKTSLQPRPRHAPPLPAPPQTIPHRYAPEGKRAGALNLFAAFDTRAGQVYGQGYERRRHCTPVHCSWMNQVEPWRSLLPRKRLRTADFESKDQLRATLEQFMYAWNQQAPPFNWSINAVAKIMAEAPALAAS